MATVELTRHLYTFFPALEGRALHVDDVTTVAEVVAKLDTLAPGLAFYLCDERGRLRRHVNVFLNEAMITDRQKLSDPVEADSRILIMQALSGG